MAWAPHQIKLVHVAKSAVKMDDDTYRALLERFGVASSKDRKLTLANYVETMDVFASLGFERRPAKRARKRPSTMGDPSRGPMLSKVEAILTEFRLPWDYADGIAKKVAGVDKVQWCNTRQLHSVLAALIYYQKRHGGPL
jgi:phage gp16-like protein